MSYILDALKRADAERERGAAPGLHTRHQLPSSSPAAPGTGRPLWLAAAGGAVLLVMAAAFWLWHTPGNPPSITNTPAVAITANTPAVTAQPAVAPAPAPASAPVVLAEAPKVQAQPAATPAPAKAAVSAPATVASVVATKPASAPVVVEPLLADLPQDLRSQIPKISITGSVYSDSPAQRLLLINNLVLAQGTQVAPELTLEEIQRRSSVFNFRGTRFRVMH